MDHRVLKDYRITRLEPAEFDVNTSEDSYKKLLIKNGILSGNDEDYLIFDKENSNIGYIILDTYRHSKESIIGYLRLYHWIPIEDKKEILKGAIEVAKERNSNSLFFRAEEEDTLLNESLSDLGFTVAGSYITNAVDKGFSYYKVYSYPLS